MELKEKEQQIKLQEICSTCGKPRKRGAVTGWLFRVKQCECRDSKPPEDRSESSKKETTLNPQSAGPSPAGAAGNVQPVLLNDRYRLETLVGEGGMGTVYKAFDTASERVVAIKMLRPELVANKVSVKRFDQEARAVRELTHPNLVSVYDYGMTPEGAPYLVMDHLEGENLAQLVENEVFLDPPRALDIFIQVCEAVGHAHSMGVIHRDLKPSNVIVSTDGSGNDFVKVVDFGIAKINPGHGTDTQQQLTQTGDVFGSPLYMSPEQCLGNKLDRRSDVYSLGCLMYEALTGRPPFSGENSIQTIFKHVNEKPLGFTTRLKGLEIPKGLETIVLRALEKNPNERYQSMDEMIEDLQLVKSGGEPVVKVAKETPDRKKLFTTLVLMFAFAALLVYMQYVQMTEPKSDSARLHQLRDVDGHILYTSEAPEGATIGEALREASLKGVNVSSVELSNANLKGVDLQGIDLSHARLVGANLEDARIRLCNFDDADLTNANLKHAHLQDCSLDRAELISTNIEGAWLFATDLSHAEMVSARTNSGTRFERSKFDATKLGINTLAGTNLSNCDLSNEMFNGLNFSNAVMERATLTNADLSASNLSKAKLSSANLIHAKLAKANLSSAELRLALLVDSNLTGANLQQSNLRYANLSGANLRDADLRQADLTGANLSGADLTGVKLSGACIAKVNLKDCKVDPAQVRLATTKRSKPLSEEEEISEQVVKEFAIPTENRIPVHQTRE